VQSVEDFHLHSWFREGQVVESLANGGLRTGIALDPGTPPIDWGGWFVCGADNGVASFNGWKSCVVDILKPFDITAGTPPAITAPDHFVWSPNFLGSGRSIPWVDEMKLMNVTTVGGGTTGARGTWSEISVADETAGRGSCTEVGGVFFISSVYEFGNTATADSYFEDENELVVFQDFKVSGSYYKISHVGNSTGTNHFQLGTSSGSGVNKEGAAGGVIQSAGLAPFRIEAIDTDIDVAAYFGVTITGPPALYDDQVRNFKVDESTVFTDDTRDFNDPGTADVPTWTTPANNDALYWGHNEIFYEINIDTGTASTGITTSALEYFNSSSWVTLTDITDGTNQFTTTGPQTITFSIPDDWAKTTVDTDNRYWIRFRIVTSSTPTSPVLDEGSVAMAGDVRWEDPAGEIIGCTLNSMGSIRVRNGSFLQKSTLADSIVPAKHAALDLGDADPTTDTVRDLTIQNCSKGVLLKDFGRFLDAGAAVDKGGGLVGIPSTAHGFTTGKSITLTGTTNYDGIHILDATTSANEIVIPDTFNAETFAVTDNLDPNETYNAPNWQFSNNTNDFRVDFPAGSTVNVNLIEGTSSDTALTSGNQDNVNSSTLNMLASVTVTFEVVDKNDAAIDAVRITAYLISDDSEVINTTSNASGIASTTFSGSTPADIYYRYRKGSGSGNYENLSGFATIESSTGASVKRSMTLDTNNAT